MPYQWTYVEFNIFMLQSFDSFILVVANRKSKNAQKVREKVAGICKYPESWKKVLKTNY